MQNIQQFIFDENDTTKLSSIKYITFPKMVNTGLENIIDIANKEFDTNMTEVSYITIDLKNNCVAYHPHNAVDSDPFGVPYLYFLYSNYKTYKKLTESMYNALHSFGNYPLGVKRTSRESGVDDLAWENIVSDKLRELMDEGGGIYIDSESQLYNLTPPDTSNMTASMKDIFDTVMRTASLGQITAGIDGGGSRNLTKSMDLMTNAFVLSAIKSACLDISETMIHNLCYLNFTKDYRLGKLKEYPYLIAKKYGIGEAIFIHNLAFWIKKNQANNRHYYRGYFWIYNSYKAFTEQFEEFSKSQIETIIKNLINKKVILKDIISERENNISNHINYYTICDKEILKLYEIEYSEDDIEKQKQEPKEEAIKNTENNNNNFENYTSEKSEGFSEKSEGFSEK